MANNKFETGRDYLNRQPLYVILGILVITMFIFGLYLASPWYVQTPGATIVQAFDNRNVQYIMALLYMSPAIVFIVGLCKGSRRLLRWSASGIFYVYLFAAVLRVVSIGFVPLIWLFILALGIIAAIIRLSMELRDLDR